MSLVRRNFVNPTSGDTVIEIAGDFWVVEDMSAGNDDAANRTTIYAESKENGSGVPVIKRAKASYGEGFQRLIVEGNGNATVSNTVYLLIGFKSEINVYLPDS